MTTSATARRAANPPSWWSHKGVKIYNIHEREKGKLSIENDSVAGLSINRTQAFDGPCYVVRWWIVHEKGEHYGMNNEVTGTVVMSPLELAAAFGLYKEGELDTSWGRELGAEAGVQGKFIRLGLYLNIPGPGYGYQGDPNLSVFLDQSVMNAVGKYLASG